MAEELTSLVQKATGRDELRHLYARQRFYLEPVHGDDALDEAMEKLGPVFQQRVKAVQVRLVIIDTSTAKPNKKRGSRRVVEFIFTVTLVGNTPARRDG